MGIDLLESTLEDLSSNAVGAGTPSLDIVTQSSITEEVPTIKDARPVQKIPFTYVVSADGIVVNLNIDEALIEGQVLEVAVKDVQDLYGNRLLSPRVWNVLIDRNTLIWQERQMVLETSLDQTNLCFLYRLIYI